MQATPSTSIQLYTDLMNPVMLTFFRPYNELDASTDRLSSIPSSGAGCLDTPALMTDDSRVLLFLH